MGRKGIIYALAVYILVISAVFISGCSEKKDPQDKGIVEIIPMQGCEGSYDSCCADECTAFCRTQSLSIYKSQSNNMHCMCWCD